MKTPLVVLNLLHQRLRTLVAVAGVAFAILLVFMQLGFSGSAETGAISLYSALDYDIVLVSGNYVNINRAGFFPRARLYQALGHEDVAAVAPLYVNWQTWRIPDEDRPHYRRSIVIVAFNTDDPVWRKSIFSEPEGPGCVDLLRSPDTVLMDVNTRDYFGEHGPGVRTELGRTRVQVVGEVVIGTGYAADGLVVTSDETYARLFGPGSLDRVMLGLIKLKPEARRRADAVKESLHRQFYSAPPRDQVQVLTRQEIEKREQDYWIGRTSVGVVFQTGVFVACVVGVIFVYQVIATDIANHFAEYATLKAMGYGEGYLYGVVLRQALFLSVLGYVPSLLVALGLYRLGDQLEHLPLAMTWGRAVGVFGLAVLMCSLSGLLALQKVRSADPADLF